MGEESWGRNHGGILGRNHGGRNHGEGILASRFLASWLLAPISWLPGSCRLTPGSWLPAPGSWLPRSWLLDSWLLAGSASWLLAPGFLAPGFAFDSRLLAPDFLAPGSWLPESWLLGSWHVCLGAWLAGRPGGQRGVLEGKSAKSIVIFFSISAAGDRFACTRRAQESPNAGIHSNLARS